MKPVRPLVRRVATVAAAVLIGTLATFVGASPADAHRTDAGPIVKCDNSTGQYQITWTVSNTESRNATLNIATFWPSGSSDTLKVNATVPPKNSGTPLTGVQTVPGTTKQVKLTLQAWWQDNPTKIYTEPSYTKTKDLAGDCKADQPSPHAATASACDGSVEVSLTNDGTAPTNFQVKAGAFSQTTPALAPNGTPIKVVVPAANAGSIDVTAGAANLGHFAFDPPKGCSPFTVTSLSDCTTLTVVMENPAGNTPISATVTSGTNPEQKFTIAGGEKKQASFPATAGTTATVTYGAGAAAAAKVAAAVAVDATKPVVLSWTAPAAAVCAPPNLPVTGTKIGGIVLAGFALLVVGAGLLLYLRRRRGITPTTVA